MLLNDPLGSKREKIGAELPESYLKAFNAINDGPNNELIVAIVETEIAGVLQITFIPNLTYQGGWRTQIEVVRVKKKYRNQGIGKQMLEWAIGRAKEKGCHMFQLTTNKKRPSAIKFYESLGFRATHEGMKLHF